MGIRDWNIDIDQWLNPYLPTNRLSKLPRPISHFLGHRNEPCSDVGNVLIACWAFVGAFVGVIIIESFLMIPIIHDHGGPIIIASFVRLQDYANEPELNSVRALQPFSNTMPFPLL